MRLISVLLYFFCQVELSSNLYSQELKIGDHAPDMTVQHVINTEQQNLRLSDFKGKLIILDFWGIYCSSCIAAFPKLDSLQKKYNDKIQIIAVNRESKEITLNFFAKHKNIRLPQIPFVTGDSILESFFPHIYVPHHVWIDSNKVVQFITNGYNTTSRNISQFLNNNDIKLAEKKDVFNFDFDKPFILEGNGRWLDKVVYYSYIMHSIPGVNTGFHYEKENNGNIHLYSTSSILDLFKFALSKGDYWKFRSKNEVVLNIKAPNTFDISGNADIDDWIAKYYFIYDLLLPGSRANKLYSIMQQDLERFFEVKAAIQRRKIKCLALIRTSKKDKLVFISKKSEILRKGIIADSLWGEWNGKMNDFIISLNMLLSKKNNLSVVNETGYSKQISIALNKEKAYSENIDLIRSELKKYDLDLIEKYSVQDVLVIKEDD